MKNVMTCFKVMKILIVLAFFPEVIFGQEKLGRKQEYLQQLMKVLPEDRTTAASDQLPGTPPAHISPEDFTWRDWLKRTGELPPDFKDLPSLPFLPDPLILDEGGENIPVKTIEQWQKKREQIKEQAQYWITGTVPDAPNNIQVEVLEEKKIGQLKERIVLLRFGPGAQAQLHVTLLIPPGEGPFPVFICPWKKNKYDWVQAAVRRGYIGCRFTATDPKYGYPDDSEAYEDLYWPGYDFTALMRWGWAASRAIDYLYTIDYINKDQIALTGLSRNGKMALWAAAYDERIKAVVPISAGTSGDNPFRYATDKYTRNTIQNQAYHHPHWSHPRIRFFVGRESKLPVDMNSIMALVAPRGLMLTSSIFEPIPTPWGIEQAYFSARKAYEFLGAEDNIAIDLRHGLHAPAARDIERYLDFFDYVFKRGNIKPDNKLYYDYSFSKWLDMSNEMIDYQSFPCKGIDDLLFSSDGKIINDLSSWNEKAVDIRMKINWGLGEEPHSVGPGEQPDFMREVIGFPQLGKNVESMPMLFGRLYYPSDDAGGPKFDKTPAVVYLHEYTYNQGFALSEDIISKIVDAGYAVYAFDQIGCGTRIEEGRLFYERFPHWSKMGRMVSDVRWAVDALSKLEFIDPQKIFTAGYALGGTVGLYSAALDERIAGTISICGFTPMRSNTTGKTAEGVFEYSHLHGLIPRLGFFIGEESRIPYDFDEILACIAPRPLFIIAPSWDQFADKEDVKKCTKMVENIYDLFDAKSNIEIFMPDDYNRFSDEMKKKMISWMKLNF